MFEIPHQNLRGRLKFVNFFLIMKTLLLVFFSIFAFPAFSSALSDEEYERRLSEIYSQYYRQPVAPNDWRFRTQNLPPAIELKFKDNFWDLSRSLFNSPLYWPKLWTANPSVENPHRIKQGASIKFESSFIGAANLSRQSPLVLAHISGLSIPESETAGPALTEWEIPSSLPPLVEFRPAISNEIDFSALKPVEISMRAVLPFYLDSRAPQSVGKAVGKDGYGRLTAFNTEQLAVRLEDSASIGSVFTVFEDRGRVGGWFSFLEAGEENIEIMIKGRIKIVSRLAEEDFVYLAVVEEALQAIEAGDSLFLGPPQMYDSSQKGPQGSGEGLIIGGASRQIMMSLGSIVYLNKGLEDGLQIGHLFYIFANPRTSGRAPARPYKYNMPILGKLKVIRLGANSATALIIESRDQIYAGDMFAGDPERLEGLDIYLDYEELEGESDTAQTKEGFLDMEGEDFDEGPGLNENDSEEEPNLDKDPADSEINFFEESDEGAQTEEGLQTPQDEGFSEGDQGAGEPEIKFFEESDEGAQTEEGLQTSQDEGFSEGDQGAGEPEIEFFEESDEGAQTEEGLQTPQDEGFSEGDQGAGEPEIKFFEESDEGAQTEEGLQTSQDEGFSEGDQGAGEPEEGSSEGSGDQDADIRWLETDPQEGANSDADFSEENSQKGALEPASDLEGDEALEGQGAPSQEAPAEAAPKEAGEDNTPLPAQGDFTEQDAALDPETALPEE